MIQKLDQPSSSYHLKNLESPVIIKRKGNANNNVSNTSKTNNVRKNPFPNSTQQRMNNKLEIDSTNSNLQSDYKNNKFFDLDDKYYKQLENTLVETFEKALNEELEESRLMDKNTSNPGSHNQPIQP